MSSTQKNVSVGKADQPTTTTTTMTTTTITVPGTNTTIQVTGTKVTIPASFGRHNRQHRQPTKTDSKSDDAQSAPGAANPKPTTTCCTCPHYKWQPSPNPSPSQARRYVPDCAKPRKGLMPTPAPTWCPVCSAGPMPPWAEAPKPKRKEGEKKEVDDEEDEAYDWRREDDFTDVWYDDMD
ncbi:hypothetical protein NCU05678 [Neurospora crassa OR74A]|uniref:Uncharacterized protein n=1 Tax=Neurospora crassa (strain ATCC 24698 / 74-OR23-1A / CBS 708.71 / DSM 1257 / FGSC 987) TaxID=367110 RepID=Q7SAY6_NEUCR|nr:hypothetical protein NCU05678 [Neurospora crassa OR74A]EAA33556.1 hypothetical protein NCU05678 [Neurospora crassa OR74A]|eukprot:XP_962792.1 hypothetical protein NCU05678 [Neurospora crassa OR74A]